MGLRAACVSFALAGVTACGGGNVPAAGPDPTLPPVGAALMAVSSGDGALQVSIWTSPQPPIKGVMDVVYRITDATGLPIDGLGVQVVPWMPAHGHGTSATPAVEPKGDGYYLAKPVYLYMSGRWELETAVAGVPATGASTTTADNVVPVVDVP